MGLTPQDISGAVQLKLEQDRLRESTISEYYDRAFKAAETEALTPIGTIGGIPVRAEQAMDYEIARLKNTDPTLERNYLAYAQEELAAGRTPLSRFEYTKALKRAGATNIHLGPEATAEATHIGGAKGEAATASLRMAAEKVVDTRLSADPYFVTRPDKDAYREAEVWKETDRAVKGIRGYGSAIFDIDRNPKSSTYGRAGWLINGVMVSVWE